MTRARVIRTDELPDKLQLKQYAQAPQSGPRLLFFSGGSAINNLCSSLKHYTHNSIHLVTPFDSGGSSACLRKTFHMPAIGDLRSRLMALADDSAADAPHLCHLFAHRLNPHGLNDELLTELQLLATGEAASVRGINAEKSAIICQLLQAFLTAMPADFDLRGASIGNLVIAGGYLSMGRKIDPVAQLISRLLNVQGTVRTIVESNLHLAAHLYDGSELLGQHRLTGKEVPPITSPIDTLALSERDDQFLPAQVAVPGKSLTLINSADLICYPPGSFYTSVLANLLPNGVATAIANNDCAKVFVPNLGTDPEQLGMCLDSAVEKLLAQLRRDTGSDCPTEKLLNFVVFDRKNGVYPSPINVKKLKAIGVDVIDRELVTPSAHPYYDGELLSTTLLSLL